MKKLLLKTIWQTLAAIVFLVAAWWIAYLVKGNELQIPPLSVSLRGVGELLKTSLFWSAFVSTLLRAVFAFVISILSAGIFAFIAYLYPAFGGFFAPIVSMLRSLPVLAVLLILLSFLTRGEVPVVVACMSLFPTLYAGVLAALSGIDTHLIQTARVYGASPWKKAVWIYLPLSAPYILREAGAALSFSLKLVVSAEVLASTAKSLGGMMQDARTYDLPTLFALVSITFLAGLILELLVGLLTAWVEKKVK